MYINSIFNKSKGNYIIISKSSGFFTFNSFLSIKIIIKQNKKLYKNFWFKKIPTKNNIIYIKFSDIILEFLEFVYNYKILKFISSKLSFKIQLVYMK